MRKFWLNAVLWVAAASFGAIAINANAKETCFPSLLQFIDNEIELGRYPGAVVVVDRAGHRLIDSVRGSLTPGSDARMVRDAIFRIYSMTKPIVSAAAMVLVERGELLLDEPVSKYLPAFARVKVHTPAGLVPAKHPISIRDLLRHTAGLTYGFFGRGEVRAAYKAARLGNRRRTLEATTDAIANLPLEHQPGTTWEYSRASTVVGRVIEVVSGESLDTFLENHIFGPLGMEDTDFYIPPAKRARAAGDSAHLPRHFDKPLLLSGGGGLVSTMADYLSFLQMMRDGGVAPNGTRILTNSSVIEMRSDQLFADGIEPGKYYFIGPGHSFGLGFGVKTAMDEGARAGPVGSYYWSGYGGTSFWVDPANGLIGILLVQTRAQNRARQYQVRAHFYENYGLDGSRARDCLERE